MPPGWVHMGESKDGKAYPQTDTDQDYPETDLVMKQRHTKIQ